MCRTQSCKSWGQHAHPERKKKLSFSLLVTATYDRHLPSTPLVLTALISWWPPPKAYFLIFCIIWPLRAGYKARLSQNSAVDNVSWHIDTYKKWRLLETWIDALRRFSAWAPLNIQNCCLTKKRQSGVHQHITCSQFEIACGKCIRL